MGFFIWKDSFSVGNEQVDRQHKLFLEMLNDCYEATSGGKGESVDADLIDKLKKYASTHFRFEENLMGSKGYEAMERHRKQHQYFESMVQDLESAHLQGKTETLSSTVSFLRDWLLNHILDEDKKFFG